MRTKRFLILLLTLMLLTCYPTAAQAADLGLTAKSALLLDAQSGDVLYELNSTEQAYPASCTKLMTLLLTLEAVEAGAISLEDTVTTSAEAASMGGSQVYLYDGEQRTVQDMLIAIAVGSGNDASYAMAEYVGGSYEHFIELMNKRAAELGMTGTHFVNPHGLHDADHYTTAADLGKLALQCLQTPHFLDYTSIYEYEFRPDPRQLVLWNTNRLLKWYDGTLGLKTGYTPEAGHNLVSCIERDGLRLIGVVLGVEANRGHFSESMKLLNFGFNSYTFNLLHSAGDTITSALVEKGEMPSVALTCAENVGYSSLKTATAEISEVVELQPLCAPLTAGDTAGTLHVYKDGELFADVPLLVAQDVPRCGFGKAWLKMLNTLGM